jgi:hypothetical protein
MVHGKVSRAQCPLYDACLGLSRFFGNARQLDVERGCGTLS